MDTVRSDTKLQSGIGSMSLKATITRADGTVEELGTVASYNRDPAAQAAAEAQGIGTITLCQE